MIFPMSALKDGQTQFLRYFFWTHIVGRSTETVSAISETFLVKILPARALHSALYHEKRIALVNNFVYLVPLKNIVQGRKGYSKVEKRFPCESPFPLFYPWDPCFTQLLQISSWLHVKSFIANFVIVASCKSN
jgi:hypothetical protein